MEPTTRDIIRIAILIFILLFTLSVVPAVAIGYYQAGIQAEVWNRQGAHMSTWEVFMGAKPITRYVTEESHDKR